MIGDAPTERLRAILGSSDPHRGAEATSLSAVLIPLYDGPLGERILFTRRTETLSSHPGEVSFPGGRVDPGDAGPLAAALREADEEVGIAPASVDVLGHLVDFRTHYGRLVCAYVGRVAAPPPVAPVSKAEVADVFLASVTDLTGPGFYEGRSFNGRVIHYWHLPQATIWGITGAILSNLLARGYAWTPPNPARSIEEMDDFRPVRGAGRPLG